MAYIGNPPAERYSSVSYQDLTGGTGTSFTLDYAVGSANEIEVFVNNVRQEPSVAYTVAGTALTMTGSIVATDDFYVVFQGKAQQTVTHPATHALEATDGTFTGDLTVDTNTLHVDSTNNRVGIGTTSPTTKLAIISNGAGGDIHVANGSGQNCLLELAGNNNNPATTSALYGQDSIGNAYAWQRANAPFLFGTNNTERMRILPSGGLTFNGDTAAANALDDYEEGTWIPTITSGVSSITYTYQSGYYTKIGDIVYAEFYFGFSGTGVGTQFTISGLPFAVGSGLIRGGGTSSYQTLSAYTLQFYGSSTASAFTIYQQGSTAFAYSGAITNSYIIGTFIYKT